MKTHEKHRAHAVGPVRFFIVTVSTSRHHQAESGAAVRDESGDVAERLVRLHGHKVAGRELIPDDRAQLTRVLGRATTSAEVDSVIFTGGTGVSPTDVTVETIAPRFEKDLPGFGEILRMESYRRIGPAAILTRATAGLMGGKLIMCLPGSPDGVRTALKIVMRDVPHVIAVARGTPMAEPPRRK